MKIFAKRKKKSASDGAAAAAAPKERTSFASDPMVEELLQMDPKDWNSKQRRMIKRYQGRKAEEGATENDVTEANDTKEEPVSEQVEKEEADKESEESSSDNDDDDDSDSDDDDDDEEEEENNEKSEEKESEKDTPAVVAEEPKASNDDKPAAATVDGDNKINPDHEVFPLLDQLNSKMKRTLTRKLDREGPSVLEEVLAEAKKLLGLSDNDKKRPAEDTSSNNNNNKNNPSTEQSEPGQPKSKKAKKNAVDWSQLTPEERLRREDQRRKQQEAAERRARGEDTTPGYKHPLNSERRRANRRKPKWKNGTGEVTMKPFKTEHNSSGYLHRKHG